MTELLENLQPQSTSQTDAAHTGAPASPGHSAHCEIRRGRLVVSGEIDQSTRSDVRAGFVEALHARDITVIDLTGVTFFGATGIGILAEFGFHERLAVLGTASIRWVLDIVGSGHLLTEVSQPA